jgi:NitT/TauT family transport system substrate-binding protein
VWTKYGAICDHIAPLESIHPIDVIFERVAMRRSLITLLVGAVMTASSVSVHAADAVSVRLKWFNQAQFAGFYVAKDKGMYQAADLDVKVQPGGPDFPAIQMVAGGNEQFGVSSADQILIARSKGVPVVAVAVLYRKSPFVLFSLKESGVTKPEQFAGKNIGLKVGGNEELVYRAMLKKANVSAKTLTETPVKFDMTPLLTGKLDVWPGYTINEVLTAREKGFDVNVMWPSDYGIDMYADTIFTTEKMIREQPDLVKRFVAATVKGWEAAATNPEEAATITVNQDKKLTYAHEFAMMKESIPLLKPDNKGIGSMELARWQAVHDLLIEGGFLKAPIDLSKAYTTQFLTP